MSVLLMLPFFLSGLFFSSNAVLMSYGGGDVSPLWYGVWGNLGVGAVMLVAWLICLPGNSWRWSALIHGEVPCWPLLITIGSRVCYPFYMTAGYFVDYGVVSVLGALFPMVSVVFGWFVRRGTESPQTMSVLTWVLAGVGCFGAGLAIVSQSSDGGLHVLNAPVMAGLGALSVVLSAVVGTLQGWGLRFWAVHRTSLVRGEGVPALICRAGFMPYFMCCAVGSFVFSGLSLVAALLLDLPAVMPAIAFSNGLLVGIGVGFWALGLMVCRTPSAHLLLYVETLAGLVLLWFSGLSRELNWPVLLAGCLLLVGSGVWAGVSEMRLQAQHRQGVVSYSG